MVKLSSVPLRLYRAAIEPVCDLASSKASSPLYSRLRASQGATASASPSTSSATERSQADQRKRRANSAISSTAGMRNMLWVRKSITSPMPPPTTSGISGRRSGALSQRTTSSSHRLSTSAVGRSAKSSLELEALSVNGVAITAVSSRRIASRAIISPAGRLCSALPRKYSTTGKKARKRVCTAMTISYCCPASAWNPASRVI